MTRNGIPRTAVLASILLMVAACVVARFVLVTKARQGADSWTARVESATQIGIHENQVIQLLGRPDEVLPRENINRYARPYLSVPLRTTHALVYTYTSSVVNIWVAYIFMDKSGLVLGHEIRAT